MKSCITFLLAMVVLMSCQQQPHHRNVRVYRDDHSLYWYVIMKDDSGACYYYWDVVPVTDFTGVPWTRGTRIPDEVKDAAWDDLRVDEAQFDTEVLEHTSETMDDKRPLK